MSQKEPSLLSYLCSVKFLLQFLAARTFPVIGKILEGYAVVLSRIIYISADGAYIFAGGFLAGEINLLKDSLYRMLQIHDAFCFQVLIALRGVGAAVNGRRETGDGPLSP